MKKQLKFMLPEIDREATRKNVEEKLELVFFYKRYGFVRKEMKITPSYNYKIEGPTNNINKPVEDCAIFNTNKEKYFNDLVQKVYRAISRLGHIERKIIIKRYLEDEYVFDYEVWNELGLSERSYYRRKAKAIYKLAFMLNAEVFIESVC